MKYRENLDFVLKGVSFICQPGEKVACVGRTGSGKSSLIQTLFRMIEIDNNNQENSFIKIDDIDTRNLGLQLLRYSISIIPQSPFVFSGTVRRNLDPLNQYSDEQIINVLKEVDLYDKVQELEDGINCDMSNVQKVFSVGQKQLLCLARAILKQNKIIVLDEATASVDMNTDEKIQSLIKLKFQDCTVFTIAHRLNTIADYDKVIVLNEGKVVEIGHPYELLTQNKQLYNQITSDGIFAQMVKHTGLQNSMSIFEVSKQSYYRNHKKVKDEVI